MSTIDVNSFLMGGGARSAKFEAHGDKVTGVIIAQEVTQQTDIKTGDLKTWDNGDPMWQLVVTLQTDQRDPDDPDDTGERKVYLKGSKPTTSLGALKAAVKAAGAEGIDIGGTLAIAYTGDGTPTQRGFTAPKEYAAKYTPPPAVNTAVDDIFSD